MTPPSIPAADLTAGLHPPTDAPSPISDVILRLLGRPAYIPEARETFLALVPDRFKVPTP